MRYFIVANSFAAPFFSDQSTSFIEAATEVEALLQFKAKYSHPAGLYSANCYASADAYHGGQPQLAQWLCNHEIEKQRLTKDISGYSFLGHEPGRFEINRVMHVVENPKEGQIV